MKPGPKPDPIRSLRDAAIEYALAVEVYDSSGQASGLVAYWDRLRKAAIRYRDADRLKGRPLGAKTRRKGARNGTP